MFCEKCGTETKENAKFCGKCGAPMSADLKRNAEVYSEAVVANKKSSGGKKVIAGVCVLAVLIAAVALFMGGGYNSDTPCGWCSNTPTKSFDGYYYCEDCATTCWSCYDTATQHFVNGLDGLTFVCDDCYEDVLNE